LIRSACHVSLVSAIMRSRHSSLPSAIRRRRIGRRSRVGRFRTCSRSRNSSNQRRSRFTPASRTHQKIECGDVRDHQQRYVDDRDRVGGAQPLRVRRKADLDGVVIVDDEVDRPHEIEGDDEQPEQRAYPHREKRQHGQHPGCEVAPGGEHGETGGQIGAYDARKDEDEPEKAEASAAAALGGSAKAAPTVSAPAAQSMSRRDNVASRIALLP
jgi:hypothetical protein